MFRLLNPHIATRNVLTHETALSLGVFTAEAINDPSDVLSQVAGDPAVERRLRAIFRRLLREYSRRPAADGRGIHKWAERLADAAETAMGRSRDRRSTGIDALIWRP